MILICITFFIGGFMKPYRLNSLVRHVNEAPVYMIINRRMTKSHSGHTVVYILIEPHKPSRRKIFLHNELKPLEAK